ncbi:MAG TPA: DEAD/DEAH box helicase [Verrucomicrobiota bacterium]|nr:DEAD/DEAH box helicase [Verrucomicrobiota bacterium]HNU51815.1 DEAD/DEAH box helicase [Verrucomicrobiota bacterium]
MRKTKNGCASRTAQTNKYDAHHSALQEAYGAFADLRRELADSKTAVAERTEILNLFAHCVDSQRAWLLLEDYFEKLSLARKDFAGTEWWPRILAAQGKARLEETALLFLRANRPLPTELAGYANFGRLAEIEREEEDQRRIRALEAWMLPPAPEHLDAPRAHLRALARAQQRPNEAGLHDLLVEFVLFRPRTGERARSLVDLIDLTSRAVHEQELFSPRDWAFIQWLADTYGKTARNGDAVHLSGIELLQWLARWGNPPWIEWAGKPDAVQFTGQLAEIVPHLAPKDHDLELIHRLRLPSGEERTLDRVRFFAGQPTLVAADHVVYLLRNAAPTPVLHSLLAKPGVSVRKLSHRLLTHLRKNGGHNGDAWESLCLVHAAQPQLMFELEADTVRLRLLAVSERDQTRWQWNGHEWQRLDSPPRRGEKPEVLDDPRLDAAAQWLRRLDLFTPEPGLWIGDANENFLATLAQAWPDRPSGADYLGNAAFQRLFLAPKQLRPRIIVAGSGIDWFSVSAEWEQEGLRLTPADLERLAAANSRFVKLPDSGWVELDLGAVQKAHETMADIGIDGLSALPQKVDLLQASHLDEEGLRRFGDLPEAKTLRERVAQFSGITKIPLPDSVNADLRPYQKDGFDFLCHLARTGLGGVLADDMGLGKTLQTLAWLVWLQENARKPKPALVICPASVLHNWRREAEKFTSSLRVLVLESGPARQHLRKQIPQHDLIVTNYALLRRDLEALRKFEFRAVILDEAQFIKNPAAQVSQSVKQLRAEHRLALTGTPLENRLLDLWSIVDFVQPAYLGNQNQFHATYEPTGPDAEWAQRMARRKLSAKLRPLLLRRLKRQVAKDLPDRIEERRDCELHEEQRKLYLAELRRSREQVLQTVQERGLAKSKMHVLAALTRLRQICCHPDLVGNDSPSGKTETLFELVEPLLEEGQKVLVFSQFVQMLQLLDRECRTRSLPTHMLTGETKNRMEVVQKFQVDSTPSIFLLSLRAAGTGLNLTTASYVILYDPWWNPAVEAQAIDRSHRIGQTRTVNAYRLITPGTVEEKIWELQQRKAQTIADVLGEEGFARSLTQADLEYLFSE